MRAISLVAAAAALAFAQTDVLVDGIAAYSRGEYATAERLLASTTDERGRVFRALSRAALGRCEDAGETLKTAFQGRDAEMGRLAGLALVQCAIAAGRPDDALGVAGTLKTRYPDDPDVLYQSARLYMRTWNDTIYRLYRTAPASYRVNQISGEILETQGKFAEAAAEYRKAIEKNPSALNVHYRLGRALLLSSHDADALEAARKEFVAELELNPGDCVAHYQVGQVLLAQQKPQDAAASFTRALELKSDFTEALIALGKLRLSGNNAAEAVPLLEHAVKLAPRSEAAHYSLMMAYRNVGRMEDARRQKAELDKLRQAPEGEFTEFLKKLGEKPAGK